MTVFFSDKWINWKRNMFQGVQHYGNGTPLPNIFDNEDRLRYQGFLFYIPVASSQNQLWQKTFYL